MHQSCLLQKRDEVLYLILRRQNHQPVLYEAVGYSSFKESYHLVFRPG